MGRSYDNMGGMPQLFWPGLAFVAATLAALAFRKALFTGLRRWSPGGNGVLVFLQAVRVPSLLWCVVVGLFVAIEAAELPRRLATQLSAVLEAAVILSITFTVAGVLGSLVGAASERRMGGGVTGLAQTSVRMAVLIVGFLVLLSSLGIAITPILTALGVGGLAVALALQDSLSNLFAGMHLLADKPIRVGDYVKLSEGVEGYVLDVGWRSTRLRTLANNVVILPNQKVAQSVITNYDLPESRLSVLIQVGVSYGADPDRVQALLVDEATKAAGRVAGLLADPPPFARLIPGFGESSLDFTLVCHVATFVDQYLVQDELRKRILRRFRAEGVEIPFPVRTVELRASGDGSAPAPPPR
ncbi:MAG TPA: mechanosensitive ion channel domain-containing protein [Methylomirabilota bacterium]|nr:mechanosensitive ion channel domain-containing protein [Methylomirabilota bacterium]